MHRPSTYGQRIPLINRKLVELVRGEPVVQVSPHCRTMIEGFSGGYHYPTLQEGQALTTKRDQPFHDAVYSHVMNAMEYGMIHWFLTVAPQVAEARRRVREARKHRLRERIGVVSF